MSDTNNNSVGSYLAFPLAITGVGAVGSVIRNKGIGNAIKAVNRPGFIAFNSALKEQGKDIFTRGIINVENYSAYKGLTKAASKQKLGLFTRFTNIFKSSANKVTLESVKAKANEAAAQLKKGALEQGREIAKSTVGTGLRGNVKSLFKKEATSKMTWVFTAMEAVPEIKNKIIPAFKNEGFAAGMKQTGKSVLKLGGSFLSFTLGGSLGRVLGGAIGTIICPGAGSAIGANIGSMVMMAISGRVADKAVGKITGEKEASEQQGQEQTEAGNVQSQQVAQQPNAENSKNKYTKSAYISPYGGHSSRSAYIRNASSKRNGYAYSRLNLNA